MVELKKINKVYKVGGADFYALKDVDLRIEVGEFISVCGASGSGKTTLLNIIGLLDKARGHRCVWLCRRLYSTFYGCAI